MLSNRNRARFRRFGRFLTGQHKFHPCAAGVCLTLDKIPEGTNAIITCNQLLSTIERGLYLGSQIFMFRNDPYEPNIIVSVGDARYVLDRRVAKEIRARVI